MSCQLVRSVNLDYSHLSLRDKGRSTPLNLMQHANPSEALAKNDRALPGSGLPLCLGKPAYEFFIR